MREKHRNKPSRLQVAQPKGKPLPPGPIPVIDPEASRRKFCHAVCSDLMKWLKKMTWDGAWDGFSPVCFGQPTMKGSLGKHHPCYTVEQAALALYHLSIGIVPVEVAKDPVGVTEFAEGYKEIMADRQDHLALKQRDRLDEGYSPTPEILGRCLGVDVGEAPQVPEHLEHLRSNFSDAEIIVAHQLAGSKTPQPFVPKETDELPALVGAEYQCLGCKAIYDAQNFAALADGPKRGFRQCDHCGHFVTQIVKHYCAICHEPAGEGHVCPPPAAAPAVKRVAGIYRSPEYKALLELHKRHKCLSGVPEYRCTDCGWTCEEGLWLRLPEAKGHFFRNCPQDNCTGYVCVRIR